jgi:small GTP-binding protein
MGLLSRSSKTGSTSSKTTKNKADDDLSAAAAAPDYSAKLVLLGDASVGKTSLALRFVNGSFHPFQEPTIGASFLSKTLRVDPAVVPPSMDHDDKFATTVFSSTPPGEEEEEEDVVREASLSSSSSTPAPSSSTSPAVESAAATATATANNNNNTTNTRRSPTSKTVLLKIWDTAGQERYQSLTPLYFRGATAALLVYDVSKYHSFHTLSRWVRELKQFGGPQLHSNGGNGSILLTVVANKADLAHEMRSVDIDEARAFAKSIGAVYMETSAKNDINVHLVFQELARRIVMEAEASANNDDTTAAAVDGGALDLAATTESEYTRSKCC